MRGQDLSTSIGHGGNLNIGFINAYVLFLQSQFSALMEFSRLLFSSLHNTTQETQESEQSFCDDGSNF
jgi:hypothetical protein